jgi:hypothetical protein
MPPKYARLAGLGAFGASAGMLGLLLLVAFFTRPPATGGITPALSAVTWIAVGVVIVALVAVHVAIGRQLLAIGRGEEVTLI